MRCANCQSDNPETATYCFHCGSLLEPPSDAVCPECGTELPPGAEYCIACGAKIDTSQGMPKDFHIQTTRAQDLAEPPSIEGERKPVTILFVDIVNSTNIAERLDPEEWKEIVRQVHRQVGAAIARYEGTVAQLLGDGLLAFFGAPITHEDDPMRAVLAGLDLQARIREFSRSLAGYVDDFSMRVGINTGEVVVGNIGTDEHVEYLAIGDAVNVAARLQSAADPGAVVISARCARLIGKDFSLKDLGGLSLKGKSEPIQAFEVLKARGVPSLRRIEETSPTRHIGRADEVEELRQVLQSLSTGHGGIVFILGEAGIGKSRLLEEARRTFESGEPVQSISSPHRKPIRWREGRALSYGSSMAFWTITQLLLDDLDLAQGAPPLKIKVALRSRLGELFPADPEEPFPYLAHLLGMSDDSEVLARLNAIDPGSFKRLTFATLRAYFKEVAERQPTVLAMEDLHWADPSSLEVLQELMALTDHVPLLIIGLMRVEREHGSWNLKLAAETDFPHRFTEVQLSRLSVSQTDELIEEILGGGTIPRQIAGLIRERSDGNPLYLEEVSHHLVEDHLIERMNGGWRATQGINEVHVPDTLQGVVLARIDRLQEDVRHTLQTASVIGKSFPYRILKAVSPSESNLDEHLTHLQRMDLVREETRLPELEYAFKQSLAQEAAYNSLLDEKRREVHKSVGEAIEWLFPDQQSELMGVLAHHFEAAGSLEKARDYLLNAGDDARLLFANEEAISLYRRALSILEELGDDEAAVEVMMKLGLAYSANFDYRAARQVYEQAFDLGQRQWKIAKPGKTREPPETFRYAVLEPRSLDPAQTGDDITAFIVGQLMEGLVALDEAWGIIPALAERWEVADDGKRYTFHLRRGWPWSDGHPVTAGDFEFAWKRNLGLDPTPAASKLLFVIEGAQAYAEGRGSAESVGVRALDDLTLEVSLERPASFFPQLLAQAVSFPLPERAMRGEPSLAQSAENYICNGAYVIETWEPGNRFVLSHNTNYPGLRRGNAGRIEAPIIVDLDKQLDAFNAGLLDGVSLFSADPSRTARLRKAYWNLLTTEPVFSTVYLAFDCASPPFDDPNVRKAFVHAIDQQALLKQLDIRRPPPGGILPPGMAGYAASLGLPYDKDLARDLLARAGYPKGSSFPEVELVFTGGSSEATVCTLLSQSWRDVLGVDVQPKGVDWNEFLRRRRSAPPPLSISGWSADYPDPDAMLRLPFHSREGVNAFRWHNAVFDRLTEQAMATIDRRKRIELYQQADRVLVNDDAAVLPLFYSEKRQLMQKYVSAPRVPPAMLRLKDVVISRPRG